MNVKKVIQNNWLYHILWVIMIFIISISYYQIEIGKLKNQLDKNLHMAERHEIKRLNYIFDKHDRGFDNILKAIVYNPIFKKYFNGESEKKELEYLFYSVLQSSSETYQLRFIDTKGMENIRYEKTPGGEIIKIAADKLQDKSDRYYFKETIQLLEGEIWHSVVDLNIEHGKIVEPYIPTIRVSMPIIYNGERKGILIANIDVSNYLNLMTDNNELLLALVDKDNYVLVSNHPEQKDWTRYLKNNNKNIFQIDDLIISIPIRLPNGQGLKINIYTPELKWFEVEKEILVFKIMLFALGAFTLWLIMSYFVTLKKDIKIQKKITKEVENYKNIIDKDVIVSRANLNGVVTYVSDAFCDISGYTREEALGKPQSILRHPDMPKETFANLWDTIRNNGVWRGELKNLTKNGEDYWVYENIYPWFDEMGKKTGYIAIGQDITDKKKVEYLAISDTLTGAYNRHYYDEIMPRLLNSEKRENHIVAYIIMDIDFFKQYNDTYGHQMGDDVIRKVAQTVKNCLNRSNDYLFRIGGEEFVIFFNANNPEKNKALQFAEKIRESIQNLHIEHKESLASQYVTVSMGLVVDYSSNLKDAKSLYKRADKLLYRAKKFGRNQICYNGIGVEEIEYLI